MNFNTKSQSRRKGTKLLQSFVSLRALGVLVVKISGTHWFKMDDMDSSHGMA